MSRNPDYEFIPTDAEEIVSLLTEAYEEITKTTVHPASPERLFIQWASGIIIHERVLKQLHRESKHSEPCGWQKPGRAGRAGIGAGTSGRKSGGMHHAFFIFPYRRNLRC